MQLRWLQCWTWVKALAVLAVLMHAGLTVRHAVHVARVATAGIIFVICHGDGTAPAQARGLMQRDGSGSQAGSCPICDGVIGGAVMLPPPTAAMGVPLQVAAAAKPSRPMRTQIARSEMPPPGRGPPTAGV